MKQPVTGDILEVWIPYEEHGMQMVNVMCTSRRGKENFVAIENNNGKLLDLHRKNINRYLFDEEKKTAGKAIINNQNTRRVIE